ncbi:hypothetical protein ACFQI7_17260 [Paenibacillus allorhizosphaerae]|uniref:Oxidoreductase molybdopterin-binding domain-containing protein n=1 Tax=Paenibacillus allorhizosphaerae TaxID=2849866 RepID=A0ABN7TI70_9BACL|nr:hypothetical protein [Paenibacillus allorhizosphaerae]CAG7631311.1 hypothetical protein PAECIP111802_01731 [Paenibacillus allorhizosphaerae]
MKIEVYDEMYGSAELEVDELAQLSAVQFEAGNRVAGVTGRAVDFQAWYRGWRESRNGGSGEPPSGVQVEAVDEFQAVIPWSELGRAMFLYKQADGEPLKKGFPLRLYVPDGSSECLNVKSVVRIRVLYRGGEGLSVSYGFKNRITPEQLRKPGES